mgnify:CR=1 FL=1
MNADSNAAQKHKPVRQLSVDVARKIAAGEVIDRPAAIVRELLDNAVDSGADSISVEITEGGIEKIRISDNGSGMTKEDLAACARPHCTSKISVSDDLLHLTTLGFRGEALSSIAAVARLSILSGKYRMKASITEDHIIEQIPPVQDGKGTIVMSEGLFENFPARRHFLKRPSSETMMCREVFIEKSLPRPDISFRLTVDGTIRHDLPGGVSLSERFARALELKESTHLFAEIKKSGFESDGVSKWSFSLVMGEASIFRNDRKHMFIFVNGRRVQEFSLMQAIEYGCQGFFPNGTHPVAALFLQVDPKMVDFNIHPAKKEVRFKDISSVHHGVSSSVHEYFRSYGIKNSFEREQEIQKEIEKNKQNTLFTAIIDNELAREEKSYHFSSVGRVAKPSTEFYIDHAPLSPSSLAASALEDSNLEAVADSSTPADTFNHIRFQNKQSAEEMRFSIPGSSVTTAQHSTEDFIYYGTIFGTFLMVQKKGIFYLIDQHAAHEKVLYERKIRQLAERNHPSQTISPPVTVTLTAREEVLLNRFIDAFTELGYEISGFGGREYVISAVPDDLYGLDMKSLFTEILGDLETSFGEKKPDMVLQKVASMSCKAAVKGRDILSVEEADALIRELLALENPYACPHGRPTMIRFSETELESRRNVLIDQYISTVGVEIKTLLMMTNRYILPSIAKEIRTYENIPTSSFANKRVSKLSSTMDLLEEKWKALSEKFDASLEMKDTEKRGMFVCEELLPIMEEMRNLIDSYEMIADKAIYPLPTYTELLF